ncbi:MAG: malto-oligosyltrehalose trehalohydrolase [Verrucomicrobiota bacterium]
MSFVGAKTVRENVVQFRVWAPKRKRVEVELNRGEKPEWVALDKDDDGFFAGEIEGVKAGELYRYRLNGEASRPDPASRFQPEGVHGPSQIIDAEAYSWSDAAWSGLSRDELAIYEIHVGTFTAAGTYAGATERLDELLNLGINTIEIMPIAQTPGRWNWGYDGVNFFAPACAYGRPDEFKAFVDDCHQRGLAVILDVVYNHIGPEGNYLAEFGPYFSKRHRTPWGEAFNFDGANHRPVRDYIVGNAVYWLEEFHLDGLRLDAIRLMFDDSPVPIVREIALAVEELRVQSRRKIHLIGETNVYDDELLKAGYDAVWSDEIPHGIQSIVIDQHEVAGRNYADKHALTDCLREGFLYEYREGKIQRKETGAKAQLSRIVHGLQTHDQVGNHPSGLRLIELAGPDAQKAAVALTLLHPAVPFLFMGEEFASTPFCFFVDYGDERLRKAVVAGRKRDYTHQDWKEFVSPFSEEAFLKSKLPPQSDGDLSMLEWYRTLLKLRKEWKGAGWLDEENLTVHHDPAHQLYRLDYGPIWVAARLNSPSKSSGAPIAIPDSGEVILHSATELIPELSPNQAAIGRRD